MSKPQDPASESHRPVNKATMDAPQEEFVADQSVPSYGNAEMDGEHGDEIAPKKPAPSAEPQKPRN